VLPLIRRAATARALNIFIILGLFDDTKIGSPNNVEEPIHGLTLSM
jgi:hypothetical protein